MERRAPVLHIAADGHTIARRVLVGEPLVPQPRRRHGSSHRWRRVFAGGAVISMLAGAAAAVIYEVRTSTLQSWAFTQWAKVLTFQTVDGPSDRVRFPRHGPYDQRLGYVDLPRFIDALSQRGFAVERQARHSPPLRWFLAHGGYAPYPRPHAAAFG